MTAPNSLADMDLQSLIRTISDFPQKGIQFRDITTLISDPDGFAESVRRLCAKAEPYQPDLILAVEARGFIFGAAMAMQMGLGLVPLRKAGKLPGPTIGIDYSLEYGSDRLEVHEGAISAGQNILIIDDLLGTGGTVLAAAQLVRSLDAHVSAALFLIDLPDLGGSERLENAGIICETLIEFGSE